MKNAGCAEVDFSFNAHQHSKALLSSRYLSGLVLLLGAFLHAEEILPRGIPPPDFGDRIVSPLAEQVLASFRKGVRSANSGNIAVDTSFPCLSWFAQGPAPTTNADCNMPPDHPSVGAVHVVVPHPGNSNIIYLASVNGGVWKTTNATSPNYKWIPLTDEQPSLSCGGMVIDPNDATGNTLVVAIGRRSSLGQLGGALIGLLRSTDGGANWTVLNPSGTLSERNFNSVAARGNIIMAGSDGGTSPGLYRSTDTGGSFMLVSGAGGSGLPAGAVMYLRADPDNATRYYVFVKNVGVYRSTDSGATWMNVNSGVAQFTAANAGLAVHGRSGTSVVYVATFNGRGVASAVFRSTNAGVNWVQMDNIGANATGGHNALTADPTNPFLVYIAGEYTRGGYPFSEYTARGDAAKPLGTQWTPLVDLDGFGGAVGNAPHTDARNLAFDAAGNLWEGDDGGIYRLTSPQTSTNGATTSGALAWTSFNTGLFVCEMHHVAYDHVNGALFGGTQDQGSPSQTARRSPIWKKDANGDASGVAVEYGSAAPNSVRYYSSQNSAGFTREIRNSLNQVVSAVSPARAPTAGSPIFAGQFITPVAVNKVNPFRLIFGGANGVFESTNRADTITQISTAVLNQFAKIAYGGRIGAVTNADALYVCVGSGVQVRTNSGGALSATPVAFPGGQAEGVVMNPNDWLSAYVIGTNRVYSTADGGASWINLTGNLTGVGTFNTIEFLTLPSGDALAVGTDCGVYIMRMAAPFLWKKVGDNLPNAPAYELWYDATDNVLAVTLLGRGAWTYEFGTPSYVVTSLADSGPGTLREAIESLGCGNISFAVNGTINLASSLPPIAGDVNINGPGTNNLTINGAGNYSIFDLHGLTNRVAGLRLANAFSTESGAAIENRGRTVLENCVLSNNVTVQAFGGAIWNFQGRLWVTNCTFVNNVVHGGDGESRPEGSTSGGGGGGGAGIGGAIYEEGPELALHGCAFIGNAAIGGNGGNGGGNNLSDARGGNGGNLSGGIGATSNLAGGGGGFGGGGGGGGGSPFNTTDDGGAGGFGGGGGGAGARAAGGSGGNGGTAGQYGGNGGTSCCSFAGGGGGGAGLGGAIFADAGTVTIVNCKFNGNVASNGLAGTGSFGNGNGQPGQGAGGAIFNRSSKLTIVNSTFSGNDATTSDDDVSASTIVTTLADDGVGSLRWAICNAAARPGPDTVTFAANLSGGIISVTSTQFVVNDTSGALLITATNLSTGLTVDGGGTLRMFHIAAGSSLTLDSLTLANGNCFNQGGSGGGAMANYGTATVQRCFFRDNRSPQEQGGALDSFGPLIVDSCTFSSNGVRWLGGAVASHSALVAIDSTFLANTATNNDGGAISATGIASVRHCTIVSNYSGSAGGGVFISGNPGQGTLTHCIVAGNSAPVDPDVKLYNCTATFNLIGRTEILTNGLGGNLVGSTNAPLNPLLGTLRNNGGPTLTMYPLPGSPIIDAGDPSFVGAGLTDQRGQPRVSLARVDIGAVEFVPAGGQAITFNGVNQYLILSNAGLSLPTNEITIEFWEHVDTVRDQFSFILSPDQTANRISFSPVRANQTTYWDFGDLFNGGRVQYSTPSDVVSNWTHWALVSTRAGNAMRIYRNGLLDASTATNRSFSRYAASLVLGARLDAPQEFFKGEIDEFRIWSAARTQSEIQSTMFTGLCAPQPNLWVYWKFDESSGTTVFDHSGNGRDATLVNGPTRNISFVPLSAPGALSIVRISPTQLRLTWSPNAGCLQSAPNVTGPWSEISGATNGQIIVTTPARQFFRVTQ